MRELVILASSSSSIISPPNPPSSSTPHHHPPLKPRSKSSISTLFPSSKPTLITPHSLSPLRSDLTTRRNSQLSYYAHLAEKLAADGRLDDFALIMESVISSGVESPQLVTALNVKVVAEGILKNLGDGNVKGVVEIFRKLEKLGIPSVKLFDGVDMELLKKECQRIVSCGEVENVVDLMETLAGCCFSIKELLEPMDIIKTCVNNRNPEMAVRYASIFPQECILFCTIINEFGKRRDLDSALKAYEACKNNLDAPNMYLYRSIIDACGLCGDYMKSRYIHEDLLNQKITPNIYVFNSLMNVNARDLGYTLHVYKSMQNLGVTPDVTSYNILLKACSRAGRVDLAQHIYREIKQLESTELLKLDVFTYCTMIKVFADAKLWKMALKVKEDMLSSSVSPNTFTWSSLISACANAGLVDQSIQLFEEMLQTGCEPNSQCFNILLHACVEACQYDRAFRLFQYWKGNQNQETFGDDYSGNMDNISNGEHCTTMPSHLIFIKNLPFTPSTTTYNTLMKACGNDYHRAKSLMYEMKTAGISPNHISWTILINVCGGSGNVKGALQTLKNMRLAGFEPDVIAYTTAIKVSVESKNLKQAFALFREMKRYQIKPNLVTYNTLLRARTRYGSLKEVQQCLAIYQDMRKAGYKSNDYYLKQLIEEWCEGVIQDNDQSRDEFAAGKRGESRRPHGLLLEKVAAHLQNSSAESLAVDLQGLSKVEARVVVLAVLRMIKENYMLGHSVKDDMWINLGARKAAKNELEVKDVIIELLQNKLGLEVLVTGSRFRVETKTHLPLNSDLAEGLGRDEKMVSSTRRPIVLQRLKVTKESLYGWLQRRVGRIRR